MTAARTAARYDGSLAVARSKLDEERRRTRGAESEQQRALAEEARGCGARWQGAGGS